MQPEMADFAAGAATSRTRRNICVVSDSAQSVYYVKTWYHPQNRKYVTYHNAVRGWQSHSHR